MTETDITNRLVLARQRRLLNLRTRIAQLEEELTALEECSGLQDDEYEVYVSKKRKQESLIKILEELLSKPIDSYIFTQGSLPTTTTRISANSSQNLTTLNVCQLLPLRLILSDHRVCIGTNEINSKILPRKQTLEPRFLWEIRLTHWMIL